MLSFWASDLWKSRHIFFEDSLWKNNCIFHWSIIKLFNLVLWRVKYANHKFLIVSHRFTNFIILRCTSYGPAWFKGWKGQKTIPCLYRICMFTVSFLNLVNPCHALIFGLGKCWKNPLFPLDIRLFFPFLTHFPSFFFLFLSFPPFFPSSIHPV